MDRESGVNLICVTDAGGESLDLQAAQVVILYDLPWTHGSFTQIIGRARRIGSTHANILTVLLSAAQTIDEEVAESLLHKERTVRAVIRQGNDASGLAEQLHEEAEEEYVAAIGGLTQQGPTGRGHLSGSRSNCFCAVASDCEL